jgi:2-phosphosulfolactate phosphatase
MKFLEALFTPADFSALAQRDLSRTTCVVFDVLRATSTMLTALDQGAEAMIPCFDLEEALACRRRDPEILLAGERGGFRIGAKLTGGVEFDFGNSPREFTRDRVAGRRIAITTTNGTRALRACAPARQVLVASFANLGATTARLTNEMPEHLCLVCSGTGDHSSYEDVLGAGALADRLWPALGGAKVDDAVQVARNCFLAAQGDLVGAMQFARNGRRLLGLPDFAPDVALCLTTDRLDFAAVQGPGGLVRRL